MAQKMYKITEIYEDISVYYVLASSKKDAREKVVYHKRDFLDPDESIYKHAFTRVEEVENSNESSSSS